MKPTNFIKFLALEATKKLNAEGHEKQILKCFKKNKAVAERALALALETPKIKIKKNRGAIFTFHFKRLILDF